jgi:4-amino-4-deoxy-L-arabinose transferase-like glycosyltransferase
LGYVNHYYTAAIVSMLKSWHNFFFVAAEPGGAVSVDKPPLGLWIQTASAAIFGVNTFGLLLPEILAGLLAVVLVYHLVRRSFGTVPGLLAALALAITPVVVATDRNNTMDSLLVLTLLLAAWAFIKATETGRLRFLLAGAVLVGLGFNVKMLEAYLPLPAFFLLYFLGSKDRIWPKLGKLALAAIVIVAISFSWIAIVDLTPASQRPYVGSSGDNSELSLALGYNGIERLLGMGRTTLSLSTITGNNNSSSIGGFGFPSNGRGSRGFGGQGFPGGGGRQGFQGGGQGFLGGGFNPGSGVTGQAGPARLFTTPLSKEASWLLPIALFAIGLLFFRERLHWPVAPKHQAMVLWGAWLLTDATFFSVAGFFHEYYLTMLAAPLAALAAIGVIEL